MARRRKNKKQRGSALMTTFGVMSLLAVAATAYIDQATQTVREANHNTQEVQTTHLCEAGIQSVLRDIWRPFKISQIFTEMEDACLGATPGTPKASMTGTVTGVGKFASGVVGYFSPGGDPYARMVTVRSIGWLDINGNDLPDSNEPRKTVDVVAEFRLARSKVFDYTYFVNNYGWMYGFSPTTLIVNGDMRANGNFEFQNGSGTINGSVIAANNDKLVPGAPGIVNTPPQKWANNTYRTNWNNAGTAHRGRWRQPYDPAVHGVIGSPEFEKWRDLVFMSESQIQNNRVFGASMEDATGIKSWVNTGGAVTTTLLDSNPTEEVIMPDLSDFGNISDAPNAQGQRFAKSKAFADEKQLFGDGTVNPNWLGNPGSQNEFNGDGTPNVNYKGAYVDQWDSLLNRWNRISTNGVVNGSVLLTGTSTRPIRIHGPVTVKGDVGISGVVQGQGTIYTTRNIHILGSVTYKNAPSFLGNNMQTIENDAEKKDFLGLAASQSIIMGDTTTFTGTTLQYMTPPFTKPRYDEQGNLLPAYNANQIDSYGIKKYQSLLQANPLTLASYKAAASGGVNQVDAVLYTNFVGGGNVGTGGGGMTLNGTIISKDEAIVAWSTPIRMNYDNRIRERTVTNQPLIDLDLPRSPTMLRSTWQDRGFRKY